MKIGILTFHWGTNYGAILQAYALQTYLESMGHEVHIINYKPKRFNKSLLSCFLTPRFYLYASNIKAYLKEKKMKVFRRKYLHETVLYESLTELKKNPPNFDVYVCGSDQIWNPSFTTKGEGGPTSTYFLDFGDKNIKKIAYAVSFGCDIYPKIASNIAIKYIPSFNAISVRENSGVQIITKMGFKEPIRLPDPTLLLDSTEYRFADSPVTRNQKIAFFYILRKEDKIIKKIKKSIKKIYSLETADKVFKPYSVEQWILGINNASIVVTNSFHGMVFSLIFHKPFVVVLSNGNSSTMNDRFNTLLSFLNLEHRILYNFDKENLEKLINDQINWQKTDSLVNELKQQSFIFFKRLLS